ncbi:MAG: flagellar biosynthetic protein FliO [Hyphomicrobiaceae bacterium]|jgi:flagellar protein FliO/FliZ|nr:flagellar biosynthetic protein FliO [Hyphomicrobiaceae bacterium]
MFDAIYYLGVVLLLALAVFGLLFVAKKQLAGGGGSLFGPKPYRRIGVVDHVSVDGKRRLILLRRDDVEHLIMTGGPVDVVIETGIVPQSVPNPVHDDDHVLAELTDEPYPRHPPTLGGSGGQL